MSADDADRFQTRPPDALEDAEITKLRELIHGSMSAEFSTSQEGKPATFPLTPFFDDRRNTIVVTSPVAYAGKARAVEEDPRVSLLLHDSSGEYLVTGDARVDSDVAANATYVRELNEREPPTPKRDANEQKYDFIDSRLGAALAGWLGQRIVIEIEPTAMVRVADPTPVETVPAWPDIGIDTAEAATYHRVVLTVVDDDGYPSMRPMSRIRPRAGDAEIRFEAAEPPDDGQPACVLLHWHDDASIHFGQRVIRGRFRDEDGSLRFVPGSSSTLKNDSLLDTARFLVDGRRRTKAYFRKNSNAVAPPGEAETPPGPSGLPILGNTHQFIENPFQFYRELPTHGDTVRYRIGWHTWTAVLHPDSVERVLVGESHRFRRYNFEDLGFDFIEDGLFFTDGEQWRRQRKVIQPAFAPAKIAAFSETIVSQTTDTVDGWGDGETIVANHVFSELVLETLTTTLFDLDLKDRREIVIEAGRTLSDRVDTRSLSTFLPAWVPTRKNRRFDRQMARFDALVDELIEERRNDDTERTDLLSTLLELTASERGPPAGESADSAGSTAPGEDSHTFTDEALRDQLVTFLFAGHETTALVLTYAFLLLSEHDDVRRKLEEELETVCGDRDPAVEDVPSLEYTENVLKETMRYYPPIYVLFREALEDVTVDGYLIPEGTKLALPQLVAHSDERWWDDPDEFRPERWTDRLREERPEYAYFPFGGGPRHCVGMRFATMFLTLSVATIARRVTFDLESDSEPHLRLSATLSPVSPVELTVRKRI